MTPPMITSMTQWFAVATTAQAIAAGISTAASRWLRQRPNRYHAMATSRFQPKCRLGIAA